MGDKSVRGQKRAVREPPYEMRVAEAKLKSYAPREVVDPGTVPGDAPGWEPGVVPGGLSSVARANFRRLAPSGDGSPPHASSRALQAVFARLWQEDTPSHVPEKVRDGRPQGVAPTGPSSAQRVGIHPLGNQWGQHLPQGVGYLKGTSGGVGWPGWACAAGPG